MRLAFFPALGRGRIFHRPLSGLLAINGSDSVRGTVRAILLQAGCNGVRLAAYQAKVTAAEFASRARPLESTSS